MDSTAGTALYQHNFGINSVFKNVEKVLHRFCEVFASGILRDLLHNSISSCRRSQRLHSESARHDRFAVPINNSHACPSEAVFQPLPMPKYCRFPQKRFFQESSSNIDCTCDHKIRHFFLGVLTGGSRAATIASSKTSLSLYCVNALHSTYFTAPSSLAILSPSSFLTGCIFCLASFSRTCGSSLRSVCVPTMRHGTPGQ